jgi:hypothetical protein
MRTATTILTALLLVGATAARAEVFQIPLPEVLGTYSGARTATFHLPGIPAVVRGASLHLVGTTEVGILFCDDYPAPTQHPWFTQTSCQMLDDSGNFWFSEANNPSVAGPFDTTAPFVTYPPAATWAFLADGEGTLTLYGGPAIYVLMCSSLTPPPSFTVTGAWLLVDADIPTPAATSSWGRVKAMYR